MKITIYVDTYPGIEPKYVFPTVTPSEKLKGNKRYAIVVDLPDPNDSDKVIEPERVTEVIDNEN